MKHLFWLFFVVLFSCKKEDNKDEDSRNNPVTTNYNFEDLEFSENLIDTMRVLSIYSSQPRIYKFDYFNKSKIKFFKNRINIASQEFVDTIKYKVTTYKENPPPERFFGAGF